MRYPRNVKIFRGGVDAAPFAGLFFATVLFTLLFYSHVFFPGVPVALADVEGPPPLDPRNVTVHRDGTISFLGESSSFEDFKEKLRERTQTGDLPGRLVLVTDPGANAAVEREIIALLTDAGVSIKVPGSRLDLPADAGFVGAQNPVVVVGVNLNGQIFFQHQLIARSELQTRLSQMVDKFGGELTLLFQADKKVPMEELVRLSEVARKAGITRLHIGTRPPVM